MSPRRTRRSRRYRRRGVDPRRVAILATVIFVIWLIVQIVRFLSENPWVIYTILGLGALILAGWIGWTFYRYKQYKETAFYQETQTPFRALKKPGMRFECDVYNSLRETFPNAKLLSNVLIPRKGSVNEYFEIDILMFSPKGIFALELKDWQGFIYGPKDDEYWTVGYKNNQNHSAKQVYSPYKQNERHIEDLNNVYPSSYYINHVIFSERGNIGEGMEDVTKLEGFYARYKQLENCMDVVDINEHYQAIRSKLNPDKLPDHIERIKFNQAKYR